MKLVYLVDDDEAIRHSASFMLRHAGFSVQTYPGGVDFLDTADLSRPASVLLDVRMPDMDGLTVLQKLKERGATVPVIVLTGHGDVKTAVDAMKLGANDFLEKPYEKQALLNALGQAFDQIEAGEATLDRQAQAVARLADLTPREREVLENLVQGLTNKGIADALGISTRTVEIHRANMMQKLQADSLSSALKIAFAAGLGGP
ncbi:MAG: response regulator [Pseudomonadota bacterium]